MKDMQNLVKMKFSLRVTIIVAVLVTIIILYGFWKLTVIKPKDTLNHFGNDGQWPEFRSVSDDHGSSNKKWESVFESSKRIYTLDNVSSCEFTNKAASFVDVDTHQLLHDIDTVYQQNWDKAGSRDLNEYFRLPQVMNVNVNTELKDRPLQVIAIPHSHNDPGWLQTLNRYYSEQTKNILNFMLQKLVQFPNMTFIWSETVFLQMWWDELDLSDQDKVKMLIKSNRLEIVNGGWIVPDEATTHYFGIVEQMIEGHQWLQENLGIKPENSWSLDVFGYSSSLAYILKRAGYDHMVILRINKFLKEYLQGKNLLEFQWRQNWDMKNLTDIFTMVLPYKLYNIKYQCGPDEFVCRYFDFRHIAGEFAEVAPLEITEKNVAVYARQLLEQYVMKNKMYIHNVVMIPIGDDFRYDREIEWDQQYLNYAKLFDYMNENWNVRARFGTVRDYFTAVEKELAHSEKFELPSLNGDFFPYTDRDQQYWTGYFTSRPYDKSVGRELEVQLRAAEILNVFAHITRAKTSRNYKTYESNIANLTLARRNLGLFQHHDAITGTARAHVVIDYEHRLLHSFEAVKHVIEDATLHLITENGKNSLIKIERERPKTMYLLNTTKTVLDFSVKKKHTIVLFNPLAQEREDVIRVTVNQAFVDVYNSHGEVVLSQLNPVWKSQTEVSDKEFIVIFLARIPALGLVKYSIACVEGGEKPNQNVAAFVSVSNIKSRVFIPRNSRFVSVAPRGETYVLENDFLRARFSARSGYIKSVTTKAKLGTTQVHSELLMYKSRDSGAYIFNPTGPAVDTEMYNLPPIKVTKGPIVSEIELMQRDDVCQHTVRIYNSTGLLGTALEINNIANMEFKEDKELVLKFKTDIYHPNDTFYTDLNGLQTAKRQPFKNFPKEANYYPMTTHAFLEDENTRLSILSAQSLGVSSQERGSLEIMLERNPRYNDGRGMGEGIRDNKRTLSQFFLLIERKDETDKNPSNLDKRVTKFLSLQAHLLQRQLQHSTMILHLKNDSELSFDSYSPVLTQLPCDTHLVNFRSMVSQKDGANSVKFSSPVLLLHKLGYDCNFPLLGIKCDVHAIDIVLNKLVRDVTFISAEEMSLSLMHSLKRWNPNEKLNLSPMELYAYKMTLAEE